MLKKILSYGFVEGIAKGLNKSVLLMLPLFIPTTDFGKVGLITSLELLLPFITLLGFERVILRFYNSTDKALQFRGTIFSAILITHVAVALIIIILYAFGIREIAGLSIFPEFFLLILLVYFQGKNQIILTLLRTKEEHREYFKLRLYMQIGKFILVVALVYITKSYLAYIVGGLIVSILADFMHKVDVEYKHFNTHDFRKFLYFSWPFIFHGVTLNLLDNADKFILEKYLGLAEVGLYTFAYSLGSMMIFAFVGISVYMEPFLYRSKSLEEFNLNVKTFIKYSMFMGLTAFTGISVLSEFVLPHIYKEYTSIMSYIPIIAIAYILYPFYLSANYRMMYTQNTKTIATLSVIVCICNIALNFYLIPKYGIISAILSTIIAYVLQALLFTFVSSKKITGEFLEIILISSIIFASVYLKVNFYLLALVLFIVVLILSTKSIKLER